jgi:threonine dehydrogenase-like Zn-dependent dehydrogenase
MKAIAVMPGNSESVHLTDLKKPSVDEVPNGRGVLIRILKVGVDGTDKEINAGEYGAAPNGYDFLVIGHEGFGQVEEVFEATGNSAVVFDAMQGLAKNGFLVLASVTGSDKTIEISADRINLGFVLGNKVMVGR